MTNKTTTIILAVLGGVVLLGAIYLLTKPKPQNNDLSVQQAGGLLVTIAELYAGA